VRLVGEGGRVGGKEGEGGMASGLVSWLVKVGDAALRACLVGRLKFVWGRVRV
jgi:hypothetical protein